MNNETNTPASYGEPWGPGQLIGHIVRTDGTFVGELNNVKDEMRVRACVNACQGIADPVEAIKTANALLAEARANLDALYALAHAWAHHYASQPEYSGAKSWQGTHPNHQDLLERSAVTINKITTYQLFHTDLAKLNNTAP